MIRKSTRQWIYGGLALALIVITTSVFTACSAASSPTPSTTPPASTPVSSAPSAQTPANSRPFGNQGQGLSGKIAKIDNDTLTVTTAQGDAKVIINPGTSIQKDVTGTISDLQAGELLTVTGSRSSDGNITADIIMIRPQSQGALFTPAPGATFTRPNRTNSPEASPNYIERGTAGTVTQINGNTLTLNTRQGDQTVNIDSSTVIQKTVTSSLADLQAGEAVTVLGPRDVDGNINAIEVLARSPGLNSTVIPGGA